MSKLETLIQSVSKEYQLLMTLIQIITFSMDKKRLLAVLLLK